MDLSKGAVFPPSDSDHGWGEIEQFLGELAELSQTDIDFGRFADELLQRTIGLLSAVGGAIWIRQPSGELRPQCQSQMDAFEIFGEATTDQSPTMTGHAQFLDSVIQAGEACVASPASTAASLNASNYLWIAAPFEMQGQVCGLIEVIQSPQLNAVTQRGNQRLLTMVGELTSDFLRRQQTRQLQQAADSWRQYERLVQSMFSSLDLQRTAFRLVNEGRTFIGCDRLTLLVPRRGNLRVIAISGVDTFDSRSATVRSLETLAQLVVQSGQVFRYRGASDRLPPQLELPLSTYIDQSHVQALELVPMFASSSADSSTADDLVGVLAMEQFDASIEAAAEERSMRVAQLGTLATRNALEFDTLPFRSIVQLARGTSRSFQHQRSRWVAAAASCVLAVLALTCIPVPFNVRAEGELHPAERRDIYAPFDGEIVEVRGQHDEDVEQGQVLLVLRSRPLEIELQRLRGEYQTTEKRLFALTSARVQSSERREASASYPGQLAAEEQELKQLLESQQRQIELLRQQQALLSVRSPIAGRVLTWNPRELLEDRPVQRGQLLMSTANMDGPWVVELQVPESRTGYVVTAQRDQSEPLQVSFTLATDRDKTYTGQVKQIAARAERIGEQPATVKITATVPESPIGSMRPGAVVYSKIHCGTESLGFVWLHDIIDVLKARLFF